MLQTGTVKESTFELLKQLQAEPLLSTTRLVGGTALSLQIGHRESDDLDLFSVEPLQGLAVQQLLIDKYGFKPSVVQDNTVIGFVNGVKIDVICHPFPWMDPVIKEEGVRIATISDIAAMKMHAIINSGKRPKDFVDVAFLLLIPEIRMPGYVFDFYAVEKRIIKMTDNPNKVYVTAPLKKRMSK